MSQELLTKALRIKEKHGAEIAKSVLADDLEHGYGLRSFIAKGVADEMLAGNFSSLTKALRSELQKDHSAFKGYAVDPDKELAGRKRVHEATSGDIPSPMTPDPEFKPGGKTQHPPRKKIQNIGVDEHPEMEKCGDGCTSCGPCLEKAAQAPKPAGVGEGNMGPPESSPHRDMLQKADDKKKEDPSRSKGQMGPQDGKSATGEDGGKKEGENAPPEGHPAGEGEDNGEGQMPQATDGSPQAPMGESGLQTTPEQMGPGQPDAASQMPPGVLPAPGSMADAILGLMTPQELEALAQLLLGVHKTAMPTGSPMTTATPGAMQVRMGPTQRTPQPQTR